MQTITAIEAAEAATNIHRVDWIHGAAELVLNNTVQYDRSTPKSQETLSVVKMLWMIFAILKNT